jgi:hypothetical protein
MESLLAYDADGSVIATLDYLVARDDAGNVTGLVDFAAHETAGGEHTDIWRVGGGVPAAEEEGEAVPISSHSTVTISSGPETPYVPGTAWSAKGSKCWPEWLGSAAHVFRVELEGEPGRKRIAALVRRSRPAGTRDERGRFLPAVAGGHRRERAAIEAAIAAVEPVNGARDIRHIVGGPGKPLALDADGKTAAPLAATGTPKHLPLIGR